MAGNIGAGDTTELDFTRSPVSARGRMPRFALTMAWWSCCSAMFWIVVSATLAATFGTKNTLIGIALSAVSYAALGAVVSRYAIRTGTSVSLFSRLLFGTSGSVLATLIFAVTAIYYAVFEGSVIALAATFLWPSLDYKIACLLVVLYSVPLVFGSVQNWLDKFNGVLLPVYLLGLVAAVAMAINDHGYSNAWLAAGPKGGASATGWWDVYVAYMGVWILMMFCFDYARFGKPQDEDFHARINFGLPFYLVTFLLAGAVGIFLVNTIPMEGALSEVSAVKAIIILMGGLGLLFVWVTQTRINTANFYLATVNLESFLRLVAKVNLSKIMSAIFVGIVVYVLMLADVFSYLLQSLAYQGIFVVAWVAVAVAHIVHVAPNEPTDAAGKPDDAYPAFNARGLIAWFGAVALGIVLMNVPSLASFSAPGTAILGYVLYCLLAARRVPVRA